MRTPTESCTEWYRNVVLLDENEYSLPTPDGRPALYQQVILPAQSWYWWRKIGSTATSMALVLLILTSPYWLPAVATWAR